MKDGWIPIFLVNRTDRPSQIGVVHGQPNFKAYRELPDGNWERVQPIGGFVMCADSIRTGIVHSGTFVRFEAAWHPPGDHPATIRYGKPGIESMTTNSGPGFWDPEKRNLAQSDSAALSEHPLWFGNGSMERIPPELENPAVEQNIGRSLAVIELLLD